MWNCIRTCLGRTIRDCDMRAYKLCAAIWIMGFGCCGLATAQSISPACEIDCPEFEECAWGDFECYNRNLLIATPIEICLAEEAACQTKLNLYKTYMASLSNNVVSRVMPLLYRDVLEVYYPDANLNETLYGFSSNQPPNNATTDCNEMYFNRSGFVDRLDNGDLVGKSNDLGEIGWLLHELAHVNQCGQLGSRDAYAKMWFDHLEQGDFASMDYDKLHDSMLLEQAADAHRDATWLSLYSCCIDSAGKLIRPLRVTEIDVSNETTSQGVSQRTLSVSVVGGARPLSYNWSIRRPGQDNFNAVTSHNGSVDSQNKLHWLVDNAIGGVYEFELKVKQARSGLPTEVRTIYQYVDGTKLNGLTVSKPISLFGETVQGKVIVSGVPANSSVSVRLDSDSTLITFPNELTITENGEHTFDIVSNGTNAQGAYYYLAGTATVRIEARLGQNTKTAEWKVKGHSVSVAPAERPRVDSGSLLAGELVDLRIFLDRQPIRAPITVNLQSNYPELVSMPHSVTFKKGQTEKIVRLKVNSNIAKRTQITLDASIDGALLVRPVSTQFEVRQVDKGGSVGREL